MSAAASSRLPDLREVIESLLPEILIAVQTTFRRCHHRSSNDEVNDICQQVIVLLMEDDFRRFRTFDHMSSQRTWLGVVVRNHVINYLERQKPTISLEGLQSDAIRYPAMEEQRLIAREQRDRLRGALTKLTHREIKLFECCYLAELGTVEIANVMGIKPQSVRRRKHALLKKLQGFLVVPVR
jgi:RNA polymerase sigma factor (sigma-70 family)